MGRKSSDLGTHGYTLFRGISLATPRLGINYKNYPDHKFYNMSVLRDLWNHISEKPSNVIALF